MANYSASDLRGGSKVLIDGDPCTVVDNEFVKPGKGQAFNRVRIRNLRTGRTVEKTFRNSDSIESADVLDCPMQYLYSDGDMWYFMDPRPSSRFRPPATAVEDAKQWLREQDTCTVTLWNGVPLTVVPPIFVELKIVETDPGRPRGYRHGRHEARAPRDRRRRQGARSSSMRAKSSRWTPAPNEYLSAGEIAPSSGAWRQPSSTGKLMVSRIVPRPSRTITTRSNPTATPAQSGSPCPARPGSPGSGVTGGRPSRARSSWSVRKAPALFRGIGQFPVAIGYLDPAAKDLEAFRHPWIRRGPDGPARPGRREAGDHGNAGAGQCCADHVTHQQVQPQGGIVAAESRRSSGPTAAPSSVAGRNLGGPAGTCRQWIDAERSWKSAR